MEAVTLPKILLDGPQPALVRDLSLIPLISSYFLLFIVIHFISLFSVFTFTSY